MKRKYTLLVLPLIAIVIYWVVSLQPREIHMTIEGVNYQLGTENSGSVQPESVTINGKVTRSWTGRRTFQGTIGSASGTIDLPKNGEEVTVNFDRNGYGPVVRGGIEHAGTAEAKPFVDTHGILFASDDFSSLTLLRHTKEAGADDKAGGGWNGEDGFMFAGPAKTREEALAVSNELMAPFLKQLMGDQSEYVLK
ncbi:hypothetical protein ACFFSY_23380 [Paenibacillus aurantiacus]|uniref:Uncharacterized protein n=1 Tax=Paenibacillus aurantiacus TaxID=1936118 RepID=A0ABV5KWS4_9BACL